MFGISPLGWLHTLGSLPAIPLMLYMFVRYGRIEPRSLAGVAYFFFMIIGGATVFLVAHAPISNIIGTVTLALLFAGYAVDFLPLGRIGRYLETIFLSVTAFLLMVPTVSEILRRVPDGHPIVTDLHSPLLLGAQGSLLVLLILGLGTQLFVLARRGKAVVH